MSATTLTDTLQPPTPLPHFHGHGMSILLCQLLCSFVPTPFSWSRHVYYSVSAFELIDPYLIFMVRACLLFCVSSPPPLFFHGQGMSIVLCQILHSLIHTSSSWSGQIYCSVSAIVLIGPFLIVQELCLFFILLSKPL